MSSCVLVVNSGSSSIKYELIDLDGPTTVATGAVERIGEESGRHVHQAGAGPPVVVEDVVADHAAGMRRIAAALGDRLDRSMLPTIDHRVVHGGEEFRSPTVVDDAVLERIRALAPLAPLHNPANLLGIEVALAWAPDVPQVAVFDTAFHVTLPPEAFVYALPYELYEEHGVRRYGFHGTSHAYVVARAAQLLGRPLADLRLISLHLGNGASACAVEAGRSIETSMGFTPLEGLVMGTRSGDVDPGVLTHLGRRLGLDAEALDDLLNRRSGLAGLCGDNDVRAIEARAEDGDPRARLALDVMAHRIKKYVGAYLALLGGADALVFTAGVGEHSPGIRARICAGLVPLGIVLDPHRNDALTGGEGFVSTDTSPVAILVAPTDEELAIAEQALAAANGSSSGTSPRSG